MALLRKGQRLSVQPVSAAEWKVVGRLARQAAERA
jgi:predicted RNA-binding protein with PUA-like domain